MGGPDRPPAPVNPGPTSWPSADVWHRERTDRRAQALHAAVVFAGAAQTPEEVCDVAAVFDRWLAGEEVAS